MIDDRRSDHSADFMLAEFETITQRVLSLERTRESRVNYYLVVVTALIGVSVVAASAQRVELWHVAATCGFLLTVGLLMLDEHVELAAQVVLLYRRAGRVRCWFHDNDPALGPYLIWAPGDDTPPFEDVRGYGTFAARDALLYSGNAGAGCALVVVGVAALEPPAAAAIAPASAVAAFALVWALQVLWVRRLAARYEREASTDYNVRFPASQRLQPRSQRH